MTSAVFSGPIQTRWLEELDLGFLFFVFLLIENKQTNTKQNKKTHKTLFFESSIQFSFETARVSICGGDAQRGQKCELPTVGAGR